MTATVIAVVVILIALAVAAYVIQQRNRQADVQPADERSAQLPEQAPTQAQATVAPAPERAAAPGAEAEVTTADDATTAQTPGAQTLGDQTPADQAPGGAPLLPRRTPGAQEMPGRPIERTDDGGGWFTKGSGSPGQS